MQTAPRLPVGGCSGIDVRAGGRGRARAPRVGGWAALRRRLKHSQRSWCRPRPLNTTHKQASILRGISFQGTVPSGNLCGVPQTSKVCWCSPGPPPRCAWGCGRLRSRAQRPGTLDASGWGVKLSELVWGCFKGKKGTKGKPPMFWGFCCLVYKEPKENYPVWGWMQNLRIPPFERGCKRVTKECRKSAKRLLRACHKRAKRVQQETQ